MYKTKSERELVYEENKDIIRALARFESTRYYKYKSNLALDRMTKRFLAMEKEGKLLRLAKELTPEQKQFIEAGVDAMLALPTGEDA